jgi:predicted membrane protein DUF2306
VILPFQLWPGSRQRFPKAHRGAGRVAATAGLFFSTTGLVLPYVMTARPLGERVFMTTFSCAFVLLLASGVGAARRRDFEAHRRWMLRTTAIALGPLTQRVIFPLFAAAGIDSMPRFWDLFLTAAWLSGLINLVVAEWWIRRPQMPAAHTSPVSARAELASASMYGGRASS